MTLAAPGAIVEVLRVAFKRTRSVSALGRVQLLGEAVKQPRVALRFRKITGTDCAARVDAVGFGLAGLLDAAPLLVELLAGGAFSGTVVTQIVAHPRFNAAASE